MASHQQPLLSPGRFSSPRQQHASAANHVGAGAVSINAQPQPQPAGIYRWVVVSLMGLAGVLVIWTRTAQSVAILPWMDSCGWSSSQKQLQLSAFFVG
jgi:hypothetical protein